MTEDLLKLVFVVKFTDQNFLRSQKCSDHYEKKERENNSVMHKEEFTGHLILYVLDDNGYQIW
jgi:hypothetical protein